MSYTIKKTNGTTVIIPDGATYRQFSINISGAKSTQYGQPTAESLLWMAENFSNVSPPRKALNGQLWYNSDKSTLNIWTGLGPDESSVDSSSDLASWSEVTSTVSQSISLLNANVDFGSLTTRLKTLFASKVDLSNELKIVNSGLVAANIFGHVQIDGNIIPNKTSSSISTVENIGTPSALWDNAYITNVNVNGELRFTANAAFRAVGPSILPADAGTILGENTVDGRFNKIYATTFNGNLQALGADVAERYHADAEYQPGTLVKIGGANEITATTVFGDPDFFGVISTAPGVKLNEDAGTDASHPYVALAGRVPVKVIGIVRKGQRLIASNLPGVAVATDGSSIPHCVGRALADKMSSGVGLVEVVVGAS